MHNDCEIPQGFYTTYSAVKNVANATPPVHVILNIGYVIKKRQHSILPTSIGRQ